MCVKFHDLGAVYNVTNRELYKDTYNICMYVVLVYVVLLKKK
jgi:hypothetical protein